MQRYTLINPADVVYATFSSDYILFFLDDCILKFLTEIQVGDQIVFETTKASACVCLELYNDFSIISNVGSISLDNCGAFHSAFVQNFEFLDFPRLIICSYCL